MHWNSFTPKVNRLPETLRMAGNNCGKIIKVSFIDLRDWQISVVQF